MRWVALLASTLVMVAGCGTKSSGRTTTTRSSRTSSSTTSSVPKHVRRTCGSRRGATMLLTGLARVYRLGGKLYACSKVNGRTRLIGRAQFSMGLWVDGPIELTGDNVAFGLVEQGVDTSSAVVRVLNLTSGKELHNDAVTNATAGVETLERVDSLVLGAHGAVAWIGGASSPGTGRSVLEVHKDDSHGESQLDSGNQVKRQSLKLEGLRLSWQHGSESRSSTLN